MKLVIKDLGMQSYQSCWQQMQQFTATRDRQTADELWIVQHPAVYTQGQAGKPEHILNPSNIPIIQTDRGGQVTYHGPGQLVVYVLLDLTRRNMGVRPLVRLLEQAVIDMLRDFTIEANSRCDAPGVYVNHAKICSIGLRIKRGYSYHGLALNVDMDLTPFSNINPCGFKDLQMTQIKHFCDNIHMPQVSETLTKYLVEKLNENPIIECYK